LSSSEKLLKPKGELVRMKEMFPILILLIFFGCKSDQTQKLGADITLNEITQISEILKNPNEYLGKKVLVEGTVIDVCKKAGCWIKIASDVPDQKIKIKVKDGDIVFPIEAKDSSALVEGVVYSVELDEEEAIEYFKHMAEDAGKEFDSTSVTGPMTIYQIKGVGAEIKM
jgi:hypothetical protein